MRLGLSELRLRPDEFWRLTPFELAVMSGGGERVGALDRAGLEALMRRCPDRRIEDG
jgi:uncharacterized phage protein (TIGR02216 family)